MDNDIVTFSTWYHSPVGPLRIRGTADYISEISFRDRSKHPDGEQQNIPPLLFECTEQLIQYFNGQRRIFELPLNQTGTPFQQQVWNELLLIPYGKTISYIELVRRIGDVKATRAVASSNGKNNVAIVVPCHRVIGNNRELVGYGGGLANKKWLLDHELKYAFGVQTLF